MAGLGARIKLFFNNVAYMKKFLEHTAFKN